MPVSLYLSKGYFPHEKTVEMWHEIEIIVKLSSLAHPTIECRFITTVTLGVVSISLFQKKIKPPSLMSWELICRIHTMTKNTIDPNEEWTEYYTIFYVVPQMTIVFTLRSDQTWSLFRHCQQRLPHSYLLLTVLARNSFVILPSHLNLYYQHGKWAKYWMKKMSVEINFKQPVFFKKK